MHIQFVRGSAQLLACSLMVVLTGCNAIKKGHVHTTSTQKRPRGFLNQQKPRF
jgi:hypothetical protein